jgi:hypothetical protein
MVKKEVVLRIDEKDYNPISRNKDKGVELVRLSMNLLDIDGEVINPYSRSTNIQAGCR